MVTRILFLFVLFVLALELRTQLQRTEASRWWVLSRDGLEIAPWQFRVMRLAQVGLLLSAAVEVLLARRAFTPAVGLPMLALVMLAQGLRYWAASALGPRWGLRLMVLPESKLVIRGPYRHLRHPSYAASLLESFAVPLMHGAVITAAVFLATTAVLVAVRIRREELALAHHQDFARLAARPRFVPLPRTDSRSLSTESAAVD